MLRKLHLILRTDVLANVTTLYLAAKIHFHKRSELVELAQSGPQQRFAAVLFHVTP